MEKYLWDVQGISIGNLQRLRKIMLAHKMEATVENLQKIGTKGLFNFGVIENETNLKANSLDQVLTALEKIGVKLHITTNQFNRIEFNLFDDEDAKIYKNEVKNVLINHNALKQSKLAPYIAEKVADR